MSDERNFYSIAGAGGGCFRKGARVQLQHGKTIAIEELKVGDEILAFDEAGEVQLAKVTKVHYHPEPQPILRVKFWRGETHITPNHWVLNQYNAFVEMGTLTIHDAVVDGMGHLRPIIDAELIGYEPVWNLTVEPHHTFICDGIRVHNGGHRETYPVIAGAGGGGSKGGGGRPAIEDPDSLQSRAMVSIVDLIGEGQIGGLVNGAKSIFFNDTPLENSDGSRNFSGVSWAERKGTQNQSPMSGYTNVETPQIVSVQVKKALPATITINNPNADMVRMIVMVPSLMSQDADDGDVHGTSVQFKFDISMNGGAYQALSGTLTINGKTRSRYQRSYLYALPKDVGGQPVTTWSIRMTRITDDSTTARVQNDLYLDSYVEIVEAKLNYPNSALVGITIDSSQFSSIPTRAYLVDGLYIKVPSNYDPVARTYSGVWNGTFKVAVSNNPAWVLYDVLTNKRYGLGEYLSASQIDKTKLYQIGKYCDELVPDGFGGYEPRFVINTAIQSQAEAFRFISDICSVFNGMTYWAGSMAGFSQDSPTEPSMIYSAANVIDGIFTYSGSARKDRHSVVLVQWNDPKQNYKRTIEYVEDADLVAKIGIRKLETVAFGCTSRGQAHRVGRWILYTEAYESDVITFKVGLDSAMVLPGEVIKIHDSTRAGKRMGGRIVSATTTSAVLDAPVTLSAGGGLAKISIRMPDGTFAERNLKQSGNVGSFSEVDWDVPLPELPLPNALWLVAEHTLVPLLARVIGVGQGENPGEFTITAIEHNQSKYDAIEKGFDLVEPKTSIIDTKTMAKPTDFQVAESPSLVAPGIMGLNLSVSWNGQGLHYEVTWRRTGKYPTNWQTVTTSNPLIDLDNARAGTYEFKIVAISPFGVRSPKLEASYVTVGKAAAPGDVPNFKVTKRTNDLLLTWDQVTDIKVSGYEVRVGPSWDAGAVITKNFQGTMLTHDQEKAGTYFYHIRSVDRAGQYSENVITYKLELTAPATVQMFDIIQSGSRLELNWRPNTEPDVVYYEIREGNSWTTGTLVSQVKATTFTIPSGGIGVRKFWIKAVSSPGIYSDVAAWIDTNIAMPTSSNIVATTDEKMLGWSGNKLNMHVVGYDLMMKNGYPRAEYIFPVDLLDSYRAQNSIYGTIDSIVYDTDAMTWSSSPFDWNDAEAARKWAPGGDINSVVGKYQIARKTGLTYGELDGWRLNGSLSTVTGKAAGNAQNVTYETGRHASGLRLRGGVKVDWTTVAVPAEFKYTTWIIPKIAGSSAEVAIMSFAAAGRELKLGYSEPEQEFRLVDHLGNVVKAALPVSADDVIGVGIVQTATKRKLYVAKVGQTPVMGEGALAPLGTFDNVRLYWA